MERRHSRNLAAVALALAVVALAIIAPSLRAQSSGCVFPNYTPVSWILGLFPGSDILVCSGPGEATEYAKFRDEYNSLYPCTQQYHTYSWQDLALVNTQLSVWLGHSLSDEARIRFILSTKGRYFLSPPSYDEYLGFVIEYYDVDGVRHSREEHLISEYATQEFVVLNDSGYPYHYWVYYVDELFATAEDQSEGYIVIHFHNEPWIYLSLPGIPIPVPIVSWEYGSYNLSSLQIARSDYTFPDYCSTDGNPSPPTVTPSPTPTGTITPPAATPSPYPTAGSTLTPYPSPTWPPVVFPTVRAEYTPTPYPVPRLAPIGWPTLAAIATPAPVAVTIDAAGADPTEVWGEIGTRESDLVNMKEDIDQVATRWADNAAWAAGVVDSQGLTTTATISGTEPISSTTQIVSGMVENVAFPVRFVKSVRLYMPNLWPLVFFVLLAFLLAFSTVMTRLAVTVGSTVVQIVRKLWEALPLN